MKVGDLVMRWPTSTIALRRGPGIVVNTCKNEDNTIFYEVQWFDDGTDCFWYSVPELEVVNESR
jgi:hypothetical protein